MNATGLRVIAVVAAVFGVATIFSGGTALFGGAAGKAFAGDAVPFVLWFNFLAGFAYVAAALAIWWSHRLAFPLSLAIASGTLSVFALFVIAVAMGVPHEARTIGAMTLRSAFWLAVAWALRGHAAIPAGKE